MFIKKGTKQSAFMAEYRPVLLILIAFLLGLVSVKDVSGSFLPSLDDGILQLQTPAQQSDPRGGFELRLGAPIERELAGGGSDFYVITLTSRQYAHVVVQQKGIDVVLRLVGPDGQKLAEIDSPNGAQGPEPVSFIADIAGIYRLEITSLDEKAERGRYEIRLEELRESKNQDEVRVSLEKALADAEQLLIQGTSQSLRMAIEKYNWALPLLRKVGDRTKEADTLSAMGSVYGQLGDSEKALEYYNQALPLRRAAADRRAEAQTLYGIGALYDSLGALQRALDSYLEGLSIWRAVGDSSQEGRTLALLAGIYREMGEFEKALDCLNRGLTLFRAAGDRLGEFTALNRLGAFNYRSGEYQKALEYYNQALPLAQIAKNRGAESAALNNIGLVYFSLREYQKALDYYNRALGGAGTVIVKGAILTRIGMTYSSLGKPDEGLRYLEQALALQRSIGNQDNEVLTLQSIAQIERDGGHLNEARAHIESALNIIDGTRSNLISQELRASYLEKRQYPYEWYIDLLMEMHGAKPSFGYDAAALQASERTRARGLLEILNEAHADIREGVDPVLLERERTLHRQLNAKAEWLTRLLSGNHSEEQAAAARKEVDALLTDYQDLEAEIRAKSPRYAALTQPQPLSLQEIQKELDADTLLVEYALGEEHSYMWAVTPTSIASFSLPNRAEIERAARQAYNLLITKADTLYPNSLSGLSQTLLGPVVRQLGHKRLIIVAHGALQYVPFGALPEPALSANPSKTAKNASLSTSHPLIVEHDVIMLPSASLVAALRQELAGRGIAPRKLLVFADPVFSKDDQRVNGRSVKRQPVPRMDNEGNRLVQSEAQRSATDLSLDRFDRLPVSRREAELITNMMPKGQWLKKLDFDASLKNAISVPLDQYQILHFATHTLLNNKRPELSGIVLSLVDEQGRPQDGFLRLHDIYNLKLNANLVVLSACDTALGKETKAEGLLGLARGFFYAGAPRVVASLWKVSDVATSELMNRFYRNMAHADMRPAEALRAAQISMLKEKQWAAPYYWAGFVFEGEWR